jgi:molybdopterin-guanine dinucleotide biosynthesis protein B
MVPYISIVGYSNSGKTTLICKLIELLTQKGLKVGTLKHDAHDFEIDQPGKDTWNHRQSGAKVVMISSAAKVAMIETLSAPASFQTLLSRFLNVDLVLVEGYKNELAKKVVVARTPEQLELCHQLEGVVAAATTLPIPIDFEWPVFQLDDFETIASLILKETGLENKIDNMP